MALPILDVLRLAPVVPVLAVDRVDDARPLAQALVAGGLKALEVTLRTPAALEIIKAMGEVDGAVVGAGTVLNADDLNRAVDAGARFIVSPGLTESVAKAAKARDVAYLPGVANSSDLMRGLEWGIETFKFFPAEQAGGRAMLKAFHGPFAAIRFCPTGGITVDSAPDYLALPNVVCVGGSWVAPAEAVKAGDWGRITDLARAAASLGARTHP